MVHVPDKNLSRLSLLLEMAFQTKGRVARVQHPLIDRAMGRMTDHATLTQRFVLIEKRPALDRMTFETSLILTHESEAAAPQPLLHICSPALYRHADVWVMAIGAAHLSLEHRVTMRELKLCSHFQVTLETGLGRFLRVDDSLPGTTTIDVEAPGPVA
jgi:hypothetical protein